MATMERSFPYDDEDMVFDELVQEYVLTKKSVEKLGVNLSARVRQKGAVNTDIVVKNVLRQVSLMVYRYLHAHVLDTSLQDWYLKHLPSARPIIFHALEQQFLYYMQAGNLSRSTDKEKRALAIDELAAEILNTRIPELGHPLTFAGRWRRV